MIHWLPQLNDVDGLQIKSPATGSILPLSAHPDLIYNANVLAQALCIKLQHGTLLSPLNGIFEYRLQDGRRLSFSHKSGLVVQIDLAQMQGTLPGLIVKHLVKTGQTVRAGQPVVKLDLQSLHSRGDNLLVLMIMPHPAITAVFSTERFVEAAKDTAILIQLKNK